MKKRLALIGLVLALLLLLVPSAAMAAKPASFSATGTISSISPGQVAQLGNSGWWRVLERDITGQISGDVSGDFTLTYDGIFEVPSQAGFMQGTLTVGSNELKFKGYTQPLDIVLLGPGIYLPKLSISGTWAGTKGLGSHGDYTGWVVFVPTPDGHVGAIVASSFTLTGQQ